MLPRGTLLASNLRTSPKWPLSLLPTELFHLEHFHLRRLGAQLFYVEHFWARRPRMFHVEHRAEAVWLGGAAAQG